MFKSAQKKASDISKYQQTEKQNKTIHFIVAFVNIYIILFFMAADLKMRAHESLLTLTRL